MLTLHAKNMAGDVLALSLPRGVTAEVIRRTICPNDPSSVRLLSRRGAACGSNMAMSDEALHDLMEELYEIGQSEASLWQSEAISEAVSEDEDEDEENLETCTWRDGDMVEYWVETEDLTVHITPPMGGPYYAISDGEEQWPLYPFTVWLDKGQGDERCTVYSWSFLFSLRDGRYCAPSEFAMEVEGGGGDIYLALRASCVWNDTVFGAVQGDVSMPGRYKEKILRAMYRKWTRTLRMMARRSLEERRVGALYGTEYVEGERAMFKQHYYALRAVKHEVVGRR